MILPDATCAFRLFGLDVALRDILLLLVATTTVYWCVQCVARHFRRQEIPHPLPMDFADIGFRMIGCKTRGTAKSQARRFEAHFGVDFHLAAALWRDLEGSGWLRYAGLHPNPEHLLYALIFLRQYCVEEIHATLCNTNVRTFRKWAWFYAEGIANLDSKYIRWGNRFRGNTGERCLVTVDGVDLALRYEIAISIFSGDIVSYTGPFNAGLWPDLKIYWCKLKRMLWYGEKVVAVQNAKNGEHQGLHETINSRLRAWECLANRFRHANSKHHVCFRSVIVMEQMKLAFDV